MKAILRSAVLFLAVVIMCALAHADSITIASVSGPLSSAVPISNGFAPTEAQWAGFHFSLSTSFDDVSISILLGVPQNFQGSAWLVTDIGDGAAAENVVTVAPASLSAMDGYVTLLSGLTLQPDDYYFFLMLPSDPGSGFGFWRTTDSPLLTTANGASIVGDLLGNRQGCSTPGCALNYVFPPQSHFSEFTSMGLIYSVTGTAASVPEPSTIALFGVCILAALRRRWR
jgi:hypothetical protein